ncbi:DUF5134 domain-containing protein [Nocardia sp. NBC_00508]|uniref:DUF5134 domain-containing protein n=1 Tax=Nocardia sp. NBC_00508 TaxID=2975992 RepID=UPI002E81238C|nr:DUF5134 domain-containing protein [Nocardia sp. NBC_00508]WUD65220.1 DUF5134 domain-containing protein [Nocardia sp. NBC_00508]
MAQFVQEYAVLRWMVVAAFMIAAAIVLARVTAVAVSLPGRQVDLADVAVKSPLPHDASVEHAESDAAHVVMCLVMLGMLLFPSGASPHALRGVLTAMVVVFAGLLVTRAAEYAAQGHPLPADRLVPLGYHIVATAAMLYAMSGHTSAGHSGGPAAGPALGLAALFLVDALLVAFAARTGWAAQPRGPLGLLIRSGGCVAALTGPARPWAAVPHVVMDAGTAYMLVAAVAG